MRDQRRRGAGLPLRSQVVVASTLLNRLRVHRPADFGSWAQTLNGLVGPVVLDPYKVVRD